MSKKASRLLKSAMAMLVLVLVLSTSFVSAFAEQNASEITPYALEVPEPYYFSGLHYINCGFYSTYATGGFHEFEDSDWNYVVSDTNTVDPFDYVVMYSADGVTPRPGADYMLTHSRRFQVAGPYSFTLHSDFLADRTVAPRDFYNCYMMVVTIREYETQNGSGEGQWNV